MIVGVPSETFPGEQRVSLVPATVQQLRKKGVDVLVESGAGAAACFPDSQYEAAGARITADRDEVFRSADVIVCVRYGAANPQAGRADLARMRPNQVIMGFADPFAAPWAVREIAERGVTAFALELLPRITRAQGMDALSSQATIAGYKAVILVADALPRMFPMLMTAAGTIAPARVLVIGAGVAGLQAIATARRLGAVVEAYDIRAAAKEQVESLGARFVDLGLSTTGTEAAGGYARAMDEDFYRRQREALARVIARCDAVITTAAVPGRRAPLLVTAEAVRSMAPGSVVVDLAAERGGNCELTRPGETVVEQGVRILGPVNLPSMVPCHASQMYAKNVAQFLWHVAPDGRPRSDGDEIARETLIAQGGKVVQARVAEALTREPGGS